MGAIFGWALSVSKDLICKVGISKDFIFLTWEEQVPPPHLSFS